jgi:hypothetical protein
MATQTIQVQWQDPPEGTKFSSGANETKKWLRVEAPVGYVTMREDNRVGAYATEKVSTFRSI